MLGPRRRDSVARSLEPVERRQTTLPDPAVWMLLERDPQIVLGERSRSNLQLRIQ